MDVYDKLDFKADGIRAETFDHLQKSKKGEKRREEFIMSVVSKVFVLMRLRVQHFCH